MFEWPRHAGFSRARSTGRRTAIFQTHIERPQLSIHRSPEATHIENPQLATGPHLSPTHIHGANDDSLVKQPHSQKPALSDRILLVTTLQKLQLPIPRHQFCPFQTPFPSPVIACGPSGSVWEAVWGFAATLISSWQQHFPLLTLPPLQLLALLQRRASSRKRVESSYFMACNCE